MVYGYSLIHTKYLKLLDQATPEERKWLKAAFSCVKCGYCRFVWIPDTVNAELSYQCPSGEKWKFEPYYASGRMEVALGLMTGELAFSDKARHILYTCTTCGACEENCDRVMDAIHPLDVIEEMRRRAVLKVGMLPKHRRFADSIEENHNPYLERHDARFKWLDTAKSHPNNSKTIYFVGCTNAYRTKEIAKATVNILKKTNTDFGVMYGDEWCCGSSLLRIGNVELAKRLMEHNLNAIREAGAEKVIFSCAGCYRAFKSDYPKNGFPTDFELIHISEYLEDLIDKGKIKFGSLEREVSYHDPCHLGRHLGVYEPPRKVLESIQGLKLTEMDRNRANSFCCGAGGGVKAEYGDFAIETATRRLEEAKATGASILVSACPFCKHNLNGALEATKGGIEVKDLTEIADQVLLGEVV